MNRDWIDGKWNKSEGAEKRPMGARSDWGTDRVDGTEAGGEGLPQQRHDQSRDDARRAVDNWLGSA